MRIKSTLIFLIALAFQSFSQNCAIELVENNVLYRGYDNVLKLSVNDTKKGEVILCGTNLEIVNNDGSTYVVNAGIGRTAELIVLRKRRSKTDTLCKKVFRVMDTPDPTIYWGPSKSGTKSSKDQKRLFAKYAPHIPLNARHKISNWEFIYGDRTISGFGADLSRAKELIDSLPTGATVTIKCEVIMPSNVRKSIYGVWQVE